MTEKKTTRYLEAVIAIPADVPIASAKEYITNELLAAGGQLPPEDPLFDGLRVVKIRPTRYAE